MGTNNFYIKNAGRTYAVGMDEEIKYSKCNNCGEKHYEYEEEYVPDTSNDCPECEEKNCVIHEEESRPVEEETVNDIFDFVKEKLSETGMYRDGGKDDQDRNFYGRSLGYLYLSSYYGDISVEVMAKAVMRSGYYEGANLDYNDFEFFLDGNEVDINNLNAEMEYVKTDMSAGWVKMQTKNISKWFNKSKDKIESTFESVYSSASKKD